MKAYTKKVDPTFVLCEPVIKLAIRELQFMHNSHGLDIGCGNGNISHLLTQSTAPKGHVTGVDISPDKIAYARDAAGKSGLSHQLSFRLADMRNLPFDDNTFDWAWSMDCVGYVSIEPLPLVKELVRVTKPGGRIALIAWSSQQLLPGYPALEAQLNATSAGIAPFCQGKKPDQHFLRALGWLQQQGLEALNAQTLVRTVHAPLSEDIREALKSLLEMRWSVVREELSTTDWLEFQRLCRPDSADFILNTSDYYGYFAYSLFQGMVPINLANPGVQT